MTMRTQIDQVLAQADRVESAWAEALAEEGAEAYGVSDKAFDRDAEDRHELADNAVDLLRELLAQAEKGEQITLTRHHAHELIFMVWDGGPEQEEHEVVIRSSHGGYDEIALLTHGAVYTVCPGCLAVNGGVHEVDRAERWNEATIETQPDTVGAYGALASGGWGLLGSEPNPLAGLPRLSIWADKNADFETDHHECMRCGQELLLPEWVESQWP